MGANDVLLTVTRGAFGDTPLDIAVAAVMAVLMIAAMVWLLGYTYRGTHHHRPH